MLVPNVLRYVNRAQAANCKSDASAILTELQADVADVYSLGGTVADDGTVTVPTGVTYGGTELTAIGGKTGTGTYNAAPAANNYTFTIETDSTAANYGTVTEFSYGNANWTVVWDVENGWEEPAGR